MEVVTKTGNALRSINLKLLAVFSAYDLSGPKSDALIIIGL
jgi:hypothetical protein